MEINLNRNGIIHTVTKENSLSSRKSLAILIGFVVFQLLFFPFEEKHFGFLAIPLFGSLGFFLTAVAAHGVNFIAFKLPRSKRGKYIKIATAISLVSAF